MCSKTSTIKCLFPSKDLIYSEPYLRLINTEETKPKLCPMLTEIRIIFKNRIKLLKGINSATTFGDLKLAMLVSRQVSKNQTRTKENYGVKKWCICESVNQVEKILTSDLLVQDEMKRANREISMLNNEFKVIYIMRLKSNLQILKSNSSDQKTVSNKIPILAEFCPSVSSKKSPKSSNKGLSIGVALKKFDTYIEERKNLIKLLENYYEALDDLDEKKSVNESMCSQMVEEERFNVISNLKVRDSQNSSFNSSNSSLKCETFV
jgi:hypothetical protein